MSKLQQTPTQSLPESEPVQHGLELAPDGGDVAFRAQAISSQLAAVPGFLATLMVQSHTASGAIAAANPELLGAAGSGAAIAADCAADTLLAGLSALDAMGDEGESVPEWATAVDEAVGYDGQMKTSGAAAVALFSTSTTSAAPGAGGVVSASVLAAMQAVMPEVRHGQKIKAACEASAGVVGPAAEKAAASIDALVQAHPGDLSYAEGIASASAGSEVAAIRSGGLQVTDGPMVMNPYEDVVFNDDPDASPGQEGAAEQAGKSGPKVSGDAKTAADGKLPVEARHGKGSSNETTTGEPGKPEWTETEKTWEPDGSGTTRTNTAKGEVGPDGAKGSYGGHDSKWDGKGAGSKKSHNTGAAFDGKKGSLDHSRENTTVDENGKTKVRSGGGGIDTEGRVKLEGGAGGKTASGLEVGVSGSGSADFKMNEDGSMGLDGASVAVTTKLGPVQTTGNVSYRDSLTGPIKQGEQFMVTATRTFTVGVGAGAKGGGETKGGASLSAQHTQSISATSLFGSTADAKAMVDSGKGPKSLPAVPTIEPPDLEAMKEGETVTMSTGTDFGIDGSVSSHGVSAGVGGSVGSGKQVQVTKGKDGKVEVTVMNLQHSGVQANGGAGLTVKGNLGKGQASHTTVAFDLSTDQGREAYARWSERPDVAPSGPGTKKTSSGSGHSVRSGVGIDAIVGTAGDSSETGRYDEELEDGRKQTTWYGHKETHAKSTLGEEDDKRKYGLTIRETEAKDGSKSTTFSLRSEVKTDSARATQEGLQEAEGELHTKDAYVGGRSDRAYTVEEEVSQENMDTFIEKVTSGDYLPKHGSKDLQEKLVEAGSDAAKRNAVLTEYFADGGAEAIEGLKGCPGCDWNQRDYSVSGDCTLTGRIGQQRVTAEMASIRKGIGTESMDGLQTRARKLFSEQVARKTELRNPASYTDLPDAARREILGNIERDLSQISRLILLLDATRVEADGGSGQATSELSSAHRLLEHTRALCESKMGNAEIDRRLLRDGDGKSVRSQYAHKGGGFAKGDAAWTAAQVQYTKAKCAYVAYFSVDPFGPGGEAPALVAVKLATDSFADAAGEFWKAQQNYAKVREHARELGKLNVDNARPLWLPVYHPMDDWTPPSK